MPDSFDPAWTGGDHAECDDDPQTHCHCDYHDGWHGCLWGNRELVRRLRAALPPLVTAQICKVQ